LAFIIAYYVEAGRRQAEIRASHHGAADTREIADWVARHYRPIAVGASAAYRLT
jgi:hypothetical protein